jgi:hypothetical protein
MAEAWGSFITPFVQFSGECLFEQYSYLYDRFLSAN